jgi:hypothetical protein
VNIWVWLGLILLILFVVMALIVISYLRLETLVSEREQVFRLSWLGNQLVVDAKARAMSWWFLGWRVLHKPLKASQSKVKEEKKTREESLTEPLARGASASS